MFDHSQAKQILNEKENTFTDDEVKLIIELLYRWAQLTVEKYLQGEEENN